MKLSSQRRCIPVGCHLRHCQRALLYAGSWNVRLLVEASGDRQICCACSTTHDGPGMERKLDLLVNLNITAFPLLASRRPSGLGLTSSPLVNGPFYIRVMSCRWTVMLLLCVCVCVCVVCLSMCMCACAYTCAPCMCAFMHVSVYVYAHVHCIYVYLCSAFDMQCTYIQSF